MGTLIIDSGAAIWLGILTSISPCPLATNIAAISYVGRKVEKPRLVLLAGLLYTLGRAGAYVGVALVASRGVQMIPGVSMFLQTYMNLLIGPLLALVGVLLTGVVTIGFRGGGLSAGMQARVDRMGLTGAGLLGVVFALAFCPVSAGLFFGALIPLAIKGNAPFMSSLYGLGTALPVVIFAFLLAFAAQRIGMAFQKLTAIERWIRRITATVLIVIGLYLILRHNFGMQI
jgi:cytochrome c biogenesis protein CcdA